MDVEEVSLGVLKEDCYQEIYGISGRQFRLDISSMTVESAVGDISEERMVEALSHCYSMFLRYRQHSCTYGVFLLWVGSRFIASHRVIDIVEKSIVRRTAIKIFVVVLDV